MSSKEKYNNREIIIIVILLFMFYVSYFSLENLKSIPLSKNLNEFPLTIDKWRVIDNISIQEEMLKMLGADEYVERVYSSPDNTVIDLYISYFNVLKEGKQFHSPKNCLIGTGSTLIKIEKIDVIEPKLKKLIKLNYMLLKKNNTHQLIIYWYQCQGQIITSEYIEKFYRIIDAIYKRRTNGAFIRVTCYDQGKGIEASLESLKQFTSEIIPYVNNYLQ
jgi:EpsI family protein